MVERGNRGPPTGVLVLVFEHVAPSFVADLLARVQVHWPAVPIFFAETRPLAEEWAFRFLGAALAEHQAGSEVELRLADLVAATPLPAAAPTAGAVRQWALAQGMVVSDRGRVPAAVTAAYVTAHP